MVKALKEHYNITINKEATKYVGFKLEWDYENGQVHVHMPGNLDKAFTQFKHERPPQKQNSPHPHIVSNYGAEAQYIEVEQEPLSLERKKQNTSKQLREPSYYRQAVDSTIPTLLSSLATKQAKLTAKTMATIKQLLNYCAMQGEAILMFKANKMILAVHSNVGYANEKHSCS